MDKIELDPKYKKVQNWIQGIGLLIIAAIASVAIIAVGASIISAAVIGIGALFMVNLLPVAARAFALWRQKAITKLTETFSEETVREDERQEGERIKLKEQQYIKSRAELEGAMDEILQNMNGATADEQEMLRAQVTSLQNVIASNEASLLQSKEDYKELQRVNKMYIAYYRAAAALLTSQGAERDPAELERIETARASIKTKMRSALAGKTVDSMNAQFKNEASVTQLVRSSGSLRLTQVQAIPEGSNLLTSMQRSVNEVQAHR